MRKIYTKLSVIGENASSKCCPSIHNERNNSGINPETSQNPRSVEYRYLTAPYCINSFGYPELSDRMSSDLFDKLIEA